MVELEKKQLSQISGGGKIAGVFLAGCLFITSIITFAIGVFDGFVRPLKCNS